MDIELTFVLKDVSKELANDLMCTNENTQWYYLSRVLPKNYARVDRLLSSKAIGIMEIRGWLQEYFEFEPYRMIDIELLYTGAERYFTNMNDKRALSLVVRRTLYELKIPMVQHANGVVYAYGLSTKPEYVRLEVVKGKQKVYR